MPTLFTGALVAQEPAWREIATSGYPGTDEVFATKLDRLVANLNDGDVGTLAGKAIVIPVAGNSRCELTHCEGVGGAIAMGDAGTDGPFLAVFWDADGAVRVAWRADDDTPMQHMPMGKIDGNAVRIHYRGGVFYSYAVESDGFVEPLIALELALGKEPLLGVLSLGDFSCDSPRAESLPNTLANTFDLELNQVGTELSAGWVAKEESASVNGSYLIHPSEGGDAFAAVTVQNLYEGSYDLWLNDHASEEAAGELNVVVGSNDEKSAFSIAQPYGKGVWLGLGRHKVLQGASLSANFTRSEKNASQVSLDAVHLLWSDWKDEDGNGLPDPWEEATGSLTETDAYVATPLGTQGLGGRQDGPTTSGMMAQPPGKGLVGGDKIVIYIDGDAGDDTNDGRAPSVRPGPWHSSRPGPLRSLQKAVDSIGDAEFVELCVKGTLDQPSGIFQNLSCGTLGFVGVGNGNVHFTSSTEKSPSTSPPTPSRPESLVK